MEKVAILQSNYIPWKGYFDIINDVDIFVFYDEVQYTHNDWRNRNRIVTREGAQWITIPVGHNMCKSIDEVQINNQIWQRKHWASIVANYSKANYFKLYKDFFEYLYLEKKWTNLSELNQHLIVYISRELLSIKTKFVNSREYAVKGNKTEKLVSLIQSTNANTYISGPAAREYIRENDFTKAGIQIVWKDYSGYPEYAQLFGDFVHNVSIIDLLFNVGEDAPYYIWGWRDEK